MNIIWCSPDGSDVTGDGSKTNPYETIEHALLSFTSGDQIRLFDGLYAPVDSIVIEVDEGYIFAENPRGATIQPVTASSSNAVIEVRNASRFLIAGVNIAQASDSTGVLGIYGNSVENFIVLNCDVSSFVTDASATAGIAVVGTGRVDNCNVFDFTAEQGSLYGIQCSESVDITECNVYDLRGTDCTVYGIYFGTVSYESAAPELLSVEVTNATTLVLTFSTDMMDDAELIDPGNYELEDYPRVESCSFVDLSNIDLVFSKALEETSAETATNYLITGTGAPTVSTATLDVDTVTVHLSLSAPLTRGESYTIAVENVTDLFGNPVDPAFDSTTLDVPSEFSWLELSPATSPSAREEHKMVFCSARNEVILFGGYDAIGRSAETWMWNGSTWTQKVISGPTSRFEHAMAYDNVNDRIVLFGGIASPRSDQTWEYNGATSTWTLISPTGGVKPGALESHAMAYDKARGEIVLFGGYPTVNNTWVYNVATSTWVQKSPTNKPSARYYHRMAYDDANNNIVLFGGSSGSSETWTWNGSDWTQKSPSTVPTGRYQHVMFYNALAGGVVMFSGYLDSSPDDNVYIWDGSNWTIKSPSPYPEERWGHDLAYDSTSGGFVLFGGYDTGWNYLGDTWIYGP